MCFFTFCTKPKLSSGFWDKIISKTPILNKINISTNGSRERRLYHHYVKNREQHYNYIFPFLIMIMQLKGKNGRPQLALKMVL